MNGKSLVTGGMIEIIEDLPTDPYIKLPNLADFDDEPTVRMQVPQFYPKVEVGNRYPGVGLIIALTMGVAMWFLPCYYFLMWVIYR